jgi:hypothetical protein
LIFTNGAYFSAKTLRFISLQLSPPTLGKRHVLVAMNVNRGVSRACPGLRFIKYYLSIQLTKLVGYLLIVVNSLSSQGCGLWTHFFWIPDPKGKIGTLLLSSAVRPSVCPSVTSGLSYKEMGLFMIVGYCMTLLFIICNEAYHASRKVSGFSFV